MNHFRKELELRPRCPLRLNQANESLQREIRSHSSHPGTVAEALALGESVLDSRSRSPGRNDTDFGTDDHRGEAAGDRCARWVPWTLLAYSRLKTAPGNPILTQDVFIEHNTLFFYCLHQVHARRKQETKIHYEDSKFTRGTGTRKTNLTLWGWVAIATRLPVQSLEVILRNWRFRVRLF